MQSKLDRRGSGGIRFWPSSMQLAFACFAGAITTHAVATPARFSDRQLAQQQRMVDCSAEAKLKSMRGDARRGFMKSCLSGGRVTAEVGGEIGNAPERPAAEKPDTHCVVSDETSQALGAEDCPAR